MIDEMFYLDNQIKNRLTCEICEQRFEDPRIVPCGKTFCNKCITPSSNRRFDCMCSHGSHLIPIEGFIINEIINQLLEEQPLEVSRGANVDELNNELGKISSKIDKIERFIKSGRNLLKDHFNEIKLDINKAAEVKMAEIKNSRDELLKNVEKYETECLDHTQNINNLEVKLIEDCKNFHDRWKIYLNEPKLDDQIISEGIRECKENLVLLDHDLKYIERCFVKIEIP